MTSPAQDELTRTVDRLQRIVDATKLLNSTLDLTELTSIILQLARDEVGVERGTVYVVADGRTHLHSLVAQEIEERFDSSFDSQFGFKTRDIYCMPIRNRDETIVGVLQLLNRSHPFSNTDEDFGARGR